MYGTNILEEIAGTIDTFREEEVVEARILKTKKGTISGYFDDSVELAKAIEPYIGQYDIYFTINPVNKALLARANNRLQTHAKQTTNDKDIEKISYIPIDIDPVRPGGISSTDEEHDLAKKKIYEIRAFLLKKGFPEPMIANSGNGYHALIYINLENNQKNVEMVKNFLNALDLLFSDERVQVDTTTYNPSRIMKLYGTIACKGDDTEERPHRQSRLVYVPEELVEVSLKQLEEIIELMPTVEEHKKGRGRKTLANGSFNIEEWIEERGLEVAYRASFQNKGTKYILKSCPWNPDHTDRSAYIIKFDGGGISAGCHHNSCSQENWETLRDLLEPDWREKKKASSDNGDDKESQSDNLIKLVRDAEFFSNEIEEAYAAVEINGHTEVIRVRSKKFKLWLQKLYFGSTGKAPTSDALNQALGIIEMQATFSDNEIRLERRVSKHEGNFYYDLADSDFRAVKITEDACMVESNPPILFIRNKNMKSQVEPDFSVDIKRLPELVNKHFRFKQEEDRILYTVYLVTCFIADIPHPILVLHGEKGAAKSTTMRMTRSLVDPAIRDLLTMPTSTADLALTLSNNYMPSFDNLDTISAEKSDMLCMAATGGGFAKRTLYTDDDETILSFKRCVTLNGINIVATRPDLLDRSVLLELERIGEEERKTEKHVWNEFEEDKAKILGAALMAVSKAIEVYPTVELYRLGRMADFTIWGYAVAEAIEIGGEKFLEAYLNNQNRANDEAISSNPVAAAIVSMMKMHRRWSGSVTALLKELEKIADDEKINTRMRAWPKASHVLSKRLKEVKSNLEQVGIYFDIRHAGSYKEVTIENRCFDESMRPKRLDEKARERGLVSNHERNQLKQVKETMKRPLEDEE